MVDWEHQLSDIIDKSNKDLKHVHDEVQSKRGRRGGNKSHSRPVLYPPPPLAAEDDGSRIFCDVIQNIENERPGPHQKAALEAFHTTRNGTTRPLSRGPAAEDVRNAEARIKRSVDRMVNDKLTGASRAIDALRDQLSVLADEVRELNRSASSQERRVDVLCHDVDSRRGVVNSMEAHMLDESNWRKSVGSEITRFKQALAQQQEDIATKATHVELKTGFESTRQSSSMSIDAAVSPLHASMRKEVSVMMEEINSVRESLEKQIFDGMERQRKEVSNSTQTFQRHLVDTIRRAVKEEAALTKKKCIEAFEEKVDTLSTQSRNDEQYLGLITEIVTTAAKKIEANLKEEMLQRLDKGLVEKLKGKRQHDIKIIKKQVKDDIRGDLTSIKDLLKQATLKQAQCITKTKVDVMVNSCHSQLTEKMGQLEERLLSDLSRSEKDRALEAMTVSLSSHNSLLQSLKKEHDKLSCTIENFVTKEEAEGIAEDKVRKQHEQCKKLVRHIDHTTDGRIKSGINENRAKIIGDLSSQLQAVVTREEVGVIAEEKCKGQYERCIKLIKNVEEMNDSKIYAQLSECKAQLTNNYTAQLQTYVTKEDAGIIAKEQYERCQNLIKGIDSITDGRIKSLIEGCKGQLAGDLSTQLKSFITKEDAGAIAEDKCKGKYEQCIKLIKNVEEATDGKIYAQLSGCKAQLTKNFSAQLQAYVTKEDADKIAEARYIEQYGRCQKLVKDIADDRLKTRINECKAHLTEDLPIQLHSFVTKDDAIAMTEDLYKGQWERCLKLIEDIEHVNDDKISECRTQLRRDLSSQLQKLVTIEGTSTTAEQIVDDRVDSKVNELKSQLRLTNETQDFATKKDVTAIVDSKCKDQLDDCTKLIKDANDITNDRTESQISVCKAQLISDTSVRLQNFVSKEEVGIIAEEKSKEQCELYLKHTKDIEHITDDKIKTQFSECKAELFKAMERKPQLDTSAEATLCKDEFDKISATLQNFITKEDVLAIEESKYNEQVENCTKLIKVTEHVTVDRIKSQIEECKSQLMVDSSRQLQNFATKAEAGDIAERKANDKFEQCMKIIGDMDHITDGRIKNQIDECKSELRRDSSDQAALCNSYATSIEGLEARANDFESDFESKMTKMLDVVESFDERVQAVENGHAHLEKQLTAKFDDKTRIEQCIHLVDKRLESKIASLQEMSGNICNQQDVGAVQMNERADNCDARRSRSIFTSSQESEEMTRRGGKAVSRNSNLPILKSHAKEMPRWLSTFDRNTFQLREKELRAADIAAMKTPPPSNNTGKNSPPLSVVHLLGLGSPASVDSICTDENNCGDTPHTPADSPCDSACSNDVNESREEIILERNRLLSNIARTLSNVAKKRDDSSLHELAAEMRAGQLATSFHGEPQQPEEGSLPTALSDTEQRSGSMIDSPDSFVGSMDTSTALSLCGVHLDENDDDTALHHLRKSESQASIEGSIEKAEAIALCGIPATADQNEEKNDEAEIDYKSKCNDAAGSSSSSNTNQSQHGGFTPPPSNVPDPKPPCYSLKSEENYPSDFSASVDNEPHTNQCPASENSSSPVQDLESLIRHISGMEEEELVNSGSPLSRNLSVTSHRDPCPSNDNIFNEQEHSPCDHTKSPSRHDVSVPGSITSFDEVECIQEERESSQSLLQYNPTRASNPEPYHEWDTLLTELQASSLILRDKESTSRQNNNSDNDSSVPSYGSGSFESEESEIN